MSERNVLWKFLVIQRKDFRRVLREILGYQSYKVCMLFEVINCLSSVMLLTYHGCNGLSFSMYVFLFSGSDLVTK